MLHHIWMLRNIKVYDSGPLWIFPMNLVLRTLVGENRVPFTSSTSLFRSLHTQVWGRDDLEEKLPGLGVAEHRWGRVRIPWGKLALAPVAPKVLCTLHYDLGPVLGSRRVSQGRILSRVPWNRVRVVSWTLLADLWSVDSLRQWYDTEVKMRGRRAQVIVATAELNIKEARQTVLWRQADVDYTGG